jgi:hypothetical protein
MDAAKFVHFFIMEPTVQHHKEDYNPGINDMFLNNPTPNCMQCKCKNPNVLSHAQMKRQADADKFIDA